MQQLTGIDAAFLYMETASSFGHVSGLSILRKPDIAGWEPFVMMRAQIAKRLPLLPPLRRRVVTVPLELDHPYWVRDPDFDLDYHVRETAIPAPGTDEQLSNLVARLIGLPLDRTHPLWECYVIDGLPDDRFAVLTKIHHATVDGASGAELTTILMDATPDQVDDEIEDDWQPEDLPSQPEVMRQALSEIVRKPGKLARLQVRSIRAAGDLFGNRGLTGFAEAARAFPNPLNMVRPHSRPAEPDAVPEVPEGAAPRTPFNGSITAHRRVAIRSADLADVKAIKNAVGATVNDVVLAICSGALRTYLAEHDALPDRPLIAMVPVSIRTGEEEERWTNRVSAIFTPIPTDVADPIARIGGAHEVMDVAKDRFTLLPADVLTDYAQFAPPALATRAIRLASRVRIGDRLNPPFNLVISNVPGPREPLYLAGATLEHYYPISTITEGQGLNVTVQSYVDRVDFGLVAARELVPDLQHLADLMLDEIDHLAKATGATTAAE